MSTFNIIGYIGGVLCVSISLFGCNDDIAKSLDNPEEFEVEISASKEVATRVTGDRWEEGDSIVVFHKNSDYEGTPYYQAVWTANSSGTVSSFNPTNSLKKILVNYTNSFLTYAWYPVLYNQDGSLKTIVDISDQRNQKKLDILGASKEGTFTSPNLTLTFSHWMYKLVLEFIPQGETSINDLLNADISLTNVYMRGQLGVKEVSIDANSKVSKWCISDVTIPENNGNSVTYNLFLVPTGSFHTMDKMNVEVMFEDGYRLSGQLRPLTGMYAGAWNHTKVNVNRSDKYLYITSGSNAAWNNEDFSLDLFE